MEPARGRGRPKKEDAMSAAERARRYRKNQKAAGLIKRYVTENTDTSATEDNAVIASNLQEAVKCSEHQMILAAIQTTESRMEAAAKLGISPRTLRYKLAKLKADNGNMAWAA